MVPTGPYSAVFTERTGDCGLTEPIEDVFEANLRADADGGFCDGQLTVSPDGCTITFNNVPCPNVNGGSTTFFGAIRHTREGRFEGVVEAAISNGEGAQCRGTFDLVWAPL